MGNDPARLRGLYAITPEREDTVALAAAVEAVLDGGATLIQYRAKSLAPGLALVQARKLAALCRARDALFIVNDSVPLALACDAHGVHVGRDDGNVREARIALPGRIVGVSCYGDPERARAAARDGADYAAIGSVFPSTTKPDARRAALSVIREAREASGLPIAAIGGITPANAGEVIAAGADMLAVISALFDAPEPRHAAGDFMQAFRTRGDSNARQEPRAV